MERLESVFCACECRILCIAVGCTSALSLITIVLLT